MATTKGELAQAMKEFAEAEGFEALSKLAARTLIAFAHSQGHDDIVFEDDVGMVTVHPITRATAQLN